LERLKRFIINDVKSMPQELIDELKKIANGFLCIHKLEDKTRIFILDECPVMMFWDGALICKGNKFRKKLEENVIIKEYLNV
jgi:hypothetical protein